MEYLLTIFVFGVRFVLLLMQAGAGWIMTARLQHRVDSSTQVERETDYSCYIRKTRDVSVFTVRLTPKLIRLKTPNNRLFLCHCQQIITVFWPVSRIFNRTEITHFTFKILLCQFNMHVTSDWIKTWVWNLLIRTILEASLETIIIYACQFFTTKIWHKMIWLIEIHTNKRWIFL